MKNYPYLWFKNISALLEKRTYSTYNILLFSIFVGSSRRFLEWVLGGVPEPFPFSFIVTLVGFYWFSFFIFTLVLRTLVDQPWRVSINVILVGIFLGIFPPILDTLLTGTGFKYAYVWGVPEAFNWHLYNPELHIPIGEAIVLWAVIFFTTLYVGYKTRSAWKSVSAFVMAYAAVIVIGGVVAGGAAMIGSGMGWQPTHVVFMVNALQVLAALLIYLILQPRLRRGLRRRVVDAAPLVALCMAGSAYAGVLSATTVAYALLLFILLLVMFAQHDYFHAVEKNADGASAYLDLEDVRFLTITAAFLFAALAAANSLALIPLIALALLGFLQLFPRGRQLRLLPQTLLLRGAWGVGAFTVGVVAAVEHAAYDSPRWWIAFLPEPLEEGLTGSFDAHILVALGAVFVGGVIFEMWKTSLGSSTNPESPPWPHRWMARAVVIMVAASSFLLVLAGNLAWVHVAAGILAAGLVWGCVGAQASPRRQRGLLLVLATYILYLSLAMHFDPSLARVWAWGGP